LFVIEKNPVRFAGEVALEGNPCALMTGIFQDMLELLKEGGRKIAEYGAEIVIGNGPKTVSHNSHQCRLEVFLVPDKQRFSNGLVLCGSLVGKKQVVCTFL